MTQHGETIELNILYKNIESPMQFDTYLGFQDIIGHCKERFFGIAGSEKRKLYKLVREKDGHVYDWPQILLETDLEEGETLELVEHPKGH